MPVNRCRDVMKNSRSMKDGTGMNHGKPGVAESHNPSFEGAADPASLPFLPLDGKMNVETAS
jgi:hypothetical protein